MPGGPPPVLPCIAIIKVTLNGTKVQNAEIEMTANGASVGIWNETDANGEVGFVMEDETLSYDFQKYSNVNLPGVGAPIFSGASVPITPVLTGRINYITMAF